VAETSITAITNIALSIATLWKWMYTICVSIWNTILTTQSSFTTYLMKHKLHSFRSIQNLPLQEHNYNTKSYLIGIDNHASSSMTNCESDFMDTLKLANVPIKGIKGHLLTSKIRTIRWIIQDDKGRPHRFDIPGIYPVPELLIRLLSPQHAV
jgi:hypothetical protein